MGSLASSFLQNSWKFCHVTCELLSDTQTDRQTHTQNVTIVVPGPLSRVRAAATLNDMYITCIDNANAATADT